VLSGTAPNLTYTPRANHNGSDSFTFKVNDGTTDSNEVTVSITINAANDPPEADAQSVTTDEDTAKAIVLNGTDVDGDALGYAILTSPSNGVLSGTAPNLTYTPNANYNGSDSFTFKVNDGVIESGMATISITVTAVNDAPLAGGDSADAHSSPVEITVTGNDSDADNNTLTVSAVMQGTHGFVSISGSQTVTYTPGAAFGAFGGDTFTYTVSDGNGGTDEGTVTISKVNTGPVAADDFTLSGTAGVTVSVSSNDTDAEGDTLIISAVTQGASGSVLNTGTTVVYTPAPLAPLDTFTYTISDGFGGTDSATVTVKANIPVDTESTEAGADGVGDGVPGEPAGSTLLKLGVPSIKNGGWKTFNAVMQSGVLVSKVVISGTEGRVLVRQRDAAPDAAGDPMNGTAFLTFSDPLINDAGHTAFTATLSGSAVSGKNKTGLWVDAFGPLALVARTDSPAPALSGALLKSIDSVVLADGTGGALLAFTGKLASGTSTVVSGASDVALWGINAGGASVLLREGNFLTVNSHPWQVKSFKALGLVKALPGHGRATSGDAVVVQAYFTNGIEAVLLLVPGQIPEVVAVVGETLAAMPGGALIASFGPPNLSADGYIGGRVRFLVGPGGVTKTDADAILIGGTAADYALLLARQGATATGTSGAAMAGVTFKTLGEPVINAQGRAAFTATVMGAGVSGANDTGLWWGAPGNVRMVARKGDTAPGTIGTFAGFTSVALPDDAAADGSVGPVFVAKLKGVKTNIGLWALNSLGELQLIALKGNTAKVKGVDKVISNITVLSAVTGSPAQPRSYNGERTLIYRLTFSDKSQKLVTTVVP
jgi:hypothetical protein